MQRLEVSGAVRPIYGSLGVKRLRKGVFKCKFSIHKLTILHTGPAYECSLTLRVCYLVCDLQQRQCCVCRRHSVSQIHYCLHLLQLPTTNFAEILRKTTENITRGTPTRNTKQYGAKFCAGYFSLCELYQLSISITN